MKRGEIYFISSTYKEEGSEQRADRPAVIVSNDKNNEHSEVVEIVYMTTRPKADLPTHVFTRSTSVPSTILCEQITTVAKERVGDYIGRLADNELLILDNALAISLGLNFSERTCPADCRGMASINAELTDEEAQELLEKIRKERPKLMTQEKDQSAELIKTETERDIYKKLYSELLEHVKGE